MPHLAARCYWCYSISSLAGFGFYMWRRTLASVVLYLLSAEYSTIMCGAWPGTLVKWPWLCLSMIYCCALRLWSQICITCQRCWLTVSVVLSRARGMAEYVQDGYGAFCQSKFECGCRKMLVLGVCGVRQNLYV